MIYKIYFYILLAFATNCYSQINQNTKKSAEKNQNEIIANEHEKNTFLQKGKIRKENELTRLSTSDASQTAVELCTNGGFEQHEQVSGSLKLKNFLYTIGDPPGPTQCRSITNIANTPINIYDPSDTNIMATTVPANFIDPYLGNVGAFDQFALKINYENSSTYGSIVQGKRYKTNNENYLKFNFKTVLMTVYDTGHTDNQPFVKAKIINAAGVVVSEFCLVGDETNCIYTKIPSGSSPILYTKNWQSGLLNISSIPNNEEFTVEFMASRCGFGGHFGYMYIDDICLLRSTENLQGSVDLNPLNKVCPSLPINVCGTYTIPNSGGITATLGTLTLNLYNSAGTSVFTTTTTSSLDTSNKQFCFTLNPTNFPNLISSNYNVGVTASYNTAGITACSGTQFSSANDPDANIGWDISFQNCSPACNFDVNTVKLALCDTNHDGNENFNLTAANSNIVTSIAGLSFSYFTTFDDANSNSNSISNSTAYNSSSKTIYVRVAQNSTCFKIIPIALEVKNPNVSISGILNVCSGSTVLTATAGASYLWNNNAVTQSITATTTGTYTVTVTTSDGCSNAASVTIDATQIATTPNVTVTQPSCFVSTGTIQITTPAAFYSFNNGVTWTTNPILNNLASAAYIVKIKTINNCISYPLTVNVIEALTSYPNYQSTNPAFCGDFGRIEITTSAPYYSFDDGATWTTNPVGTNLAPGTYKLRTKDIAGCISNFNTVLLSSETLEPPLYTVINPACGVSGSIVINTASDFYTFDGGTTWSTSNILTNLTTGSYSIAIKNNLGCTSAYLFANVNDLQDTYPIVTVVQPICGSGGSIAITTVAPFYSFDNGATWSTTSIATNLPPNNYEILVKNASGCVSLVSNVSLNIPYLDSPIYEVTQPSCGINGTITVNTLSDFYSYDNGLTWVTTNSMNLPSGYYSVITKNNLGCVSYPTTVSLYVPVLPSPTYTVIQPTCSSLGSITINTPAAFYSIDAGVTWFTNPIFTNVPNLYYVVKIKNSLGCESDYSYVYLNSTILPNPTFTYNNPACGNIGSITITSIADFYSIDNGITWSTNPIFNNLLSAYYTVIIKNSAGCVSNSNSFYLNSNTVSAPTAAVVNPCANNSATGSISFTTVAAFYSIDNGSTWSINPVFTNLSTNYYYLKIKTASGCESYSNSLYLSTYLSSPNITFITPKCGINGSITVTTSAAFYSIDGGNSWVTNPVFTNLTQGVYYVKIKNAVGCTSDNEYVNFAQPYILDPTFVVTQPICGVLGIISISTPAAQYSKDSGNTWQTNPVFTNLQPGYYNIVIKNSLGCLSNGSQVFIDTYYIPNPNITIVQPTCGSNGSITIATVASQYSFNGGNTWSTTATTSNLAPGYYNIMIKNSQGCTSSPYSMPVTIREYYLPTPLHTVDQPSCGSIGNISILTSADFYSFDNGTTWSTNSILSNPSPGSYYIKVKNNLGCTSQSETVYINSFFIPAPAVTVIQPSCSVPTGTITVNSPAAQYSFNDGSTWVTSGVLSSVSSGYYYIRIKNSLGCLSSSAFVYVSSAPFIPSAPSVSSIQPTSCGTTDGSITINTAATEYSFNNGTTWTTNPTKINLGAGTYYIKTRSNSNTCESAAAIITLNSGVTVSAPTFSVINPGCSSQFGSITITTLATYYSFDNGITFVTSNTKTNLLPGQYNVKIKNVAGCISFASTASIINAPVLAAPQLTAIQPTCTSITGSINVVTAASEFSYDNGVSFSTENPKNGLSPGIYLVKIKDASGCISTATEITINLQPIIPIQPNVVITHPTNCTVSTGLLTVTSPGISYSFDNGVTWSTSNISNALQAGTYQIVIKETLTGCTSNPTAAVINAPPDRPVPPLLSINQPSSCVYPFGSISITNTAFQYSFDNGINYSTNSMSGALSPGTYLVKVKNSSNCESSGVEVILNPPLDYPALPTFTILQPDCNNPTGKITITSIANEYSFDNGLSWSTFATSTFLSAGSYNLKVKNSLGCLSQTANANIIPFTNFTASPTFTSPQYFCIQNTNTINSIQITGQNIKWYDAQTNGNLLSATTILQNGITYYASQTINSCESLRVPLLVNIQNTSTPTANANQSFCATQNATLTEIVITGDNINWYSSVSSTIILPSTSLISNGGTYYATQTINGCESTTRQPVTITLINTLNATDFSDYKCDDNDKGSFVVDLTTYNSNLILNTSNCTFDFYESSSGATNQTVDDKITSTTAFNLPLGTTIIYVRITSINTCHQIVELKLTLYPKPKITIKDIAPICENQNITVDAGTGFDSYVWSIAGATNQQSIIVSQPGSYSVTITKNNGPITCSATKNFEVVKSNKATIKSIEISDFTATENTISVNLTSSSVGDYEYSLDGINYQDSPIFTDLIYGLYNVYVKDKNGCGIVDGEIYLLMYPKFFTPNGDGFNDLWKIDFSEIEPNLDIKILDRYGKLIKQLNGLSSGWDGTYNALDLPADDYWFVITRQNGKEIKGHFALKR